MRKIDLLENYDITKIVGSMFIFPDTVMTPDSIIVPEIMLQNGKPQIVGFSVIDRDMLITKEHRAEKYGNAMNWKEPIKVGEEPQNAIIINESLKKGGTNG